MKLRKTSIILIIILMLSTVAVFSQSGNYYWYYGRNKVIDRKFEWRVMETPHFKIHYYDRNPRLLKLIAVEAEKAYDRLSRMLNVQVKDKIPMIFYKSHMDFEHTNLHPGFMPTGALGFSEPMGNRVVIQGDMPPAELTRLIKHELGHTFEYQVVGRRKMMFRPPPGWVVEGFSDYVTDHWDSFDLLIVRDMVINDQIAQISRYGGLMTAQNVGRNEYNWGHMLMDFIAQKYGERGIRNLMYTYRGGRLLGPAKNFLRSFSTSHKLFNFEFKQFARDRFKKFFTKENPEEYSFNIGPEMPFFFSFSHQLSPSGEVLAVLTANMVSRDFDFVLISMKDGRVIKNITPGITSEYDNINMLFNPAEGAAFSWDPQGEKIAYFARKEWKTFLVVMDILDGKTLKKVTLENIEEPSSPVFHPDGKEIYFRGIDRSKSYIFAFDLTTEKTRRITDGELYVKGLDISRDGKKVVFSAQQDEYLKLYVGPIEKPEAARQITGGEYNDIAPSFSRDGKFVYYSSDELESYNLYGIDLENQVKYRYTDVRTGNFFPVDIPGKKNELVFSAFHKGMFHLFKKDISTYLEKSDIEISAFVAPSQDEEVESEEIENRPMQEGSGLFAGVAKKIRNRLSPGEDFEIKDDLKYKPLKNLMITGLPSITAGYGTDGSLFGYTSLNLTDLMGDYNFQFSAFSFYGYQSYRLLYLNLKNRIQHYLHFFYYTDSFWISYNAYLKLRERYGMEAGFFFPFNRDYRAELALTWHRQKENYDALRYGTDIPYAQFFDGPALSVTAALTAETTRFQRYGPNMGHTFRILYRKYINQLGDSYLNAYSIEADFRKYIHINNEALLAFRFAGFTSGGDTPQLFWIGGDNTIRASGFRRMVGNNAFHFNAEFRFPLFNLSSTFLSVGGPIRGVLFFDLGGAWMNDQKFRLLEEDRFKLKDAVSSYGFGFMFNLWGYPVHLDVVYRTDLFASKWYRVNFWIGFDF